MDFLVQAAQSNAVVVAVLAPMVLVVDRLSRRPALAHRLWLLLLLKLVTPPLVPITFPWAANSRGGPPAAATPSLAAEDTSRTADASGNRSAERKAGQPTDSRPSLDPSPLPVRAFNLAEFAVRQGSLRWGPALAGLWLGASALWLAWTLHQILRVRQRLSTIAPAPPDVQEAARQVARKLELKGTPLVCFVPWVISPGLWAVGRRSRLLVPERL
jgi:bla regulator protein BlaR1